MNLHIIVAMTEKGVIGKDNMLPWHIPEDMKLFKELTTGNTVIMGRKTYESIGKPLRNRNNIVISKTLREQHEAGFAVCRTLDEAIEKAQKYNADAFVIGGRTLYDEALQKTGYLHISEVKKDYEGNVFFPDFSINNWKITYWLAYNEFIYKIYERKTESNENKGQ